MNPSPRSSPRGAAHRAAPSPAEKAETPALGYAAVVISACVLIFFVLVAFIFWLGGLAEKPFEAGAGADASSSPGGPELAPAAGD